jgi:hypothetical protein
MVAEGGGQKNKSGGEIPAACVVSGSNDPPEAIS